MCGIVGYLGKQKASGILLERLKRLGYRGYDSSGLAVWEEGSLNVTRRVGRVKELLRAVNQSPADSMWISLATLQSRLRWNKTSL